MCFNSAELTFITIAIIMMAEDAANEGGGKRRQTGREGEEGSKQDGRKTSLSQSVSG